MGIKTNMMTSSNGNIFRVAGHLCGNSPVTGEFPTKRPVTRSFDAFFYLHLWVNNREAGEMRRHRAHCDVIVMNKLKENTGSSHWVSWTVIIRQKCNQLQYVRLLSSNCRFFNWYSLTSINTILFCFVFLQFYYPFSFDPRDSFTYTKTQPISSVRYFRSFFRIIEALVIHWIPRDLIFGSSAAATPAKYERDSKYLTYTFAKQKYPHRRNERAEM